MNFSTVDLYKELKKVKRKNSLVEEANQILHRESMKDAAIKERIFNGENNPNLNYEAFDEKNIFSLQQIKEICIQYRLRFLDSARFKGEIPAEAIFKIKQLEKETGQVLNNFKIIAPKKLFKLDDKDSDPLLFVELSDNKYYFIHKWGGELNRFRFILSYPFRSFMHMFGFLILVAFIFSSLIPTSSTIVFAFLFVHSFIAICGIACLIIFSRRENFSDVEWDSKYLS